MYEIVNKILHGIWGVWRFRWTALSVAWLIAILGWVVVHKLDHKYFSSARIYIDTNQVLEPLLQGLAIQPDVRQRVEMMSKTLLSRPNLERLIEETDLLQASNESGSNQQLIDGLLDELAIYDSSGSRSIYTIGYVHSDPLIAKQVVQTLINIFVESNLGEERDDNTAAKKFLDERIANYETRLAAAEKRLSDFKRENAGSMPGESGGYYQRIEAAESQLRTASLALKEVQNRRDELKRQLDSEEPILLNPDPGYVPPDVLRIQTLQNQLDGLLVRYTDRHPQVAQLRRAIDDLEKQREMDVAKRETANARPASAVPSIVNQQLRTMLAESEARAAELTVRKAYYQEELDNLRATVDSIPLVEEKLVQLDRDYITVRSQHETLLERRETARLTEAVKKNSDDVKFRVVDPPYVDARPAVPNKKILNVGVFGASLAVGGGLSFLLALLFPVFYDKHSLAMASSLPIIGGVTLHRSFTIRIKSFLGVCLFFLLLVILFVTLMTLILLEIRDIKLAEFLLSYEVPFVSDIIQLELYNKIIDSALFNKLTSIVENFL